MDENAESRVVLRGGGGGGGGRFAASGGGDAAAESLFSVSSFATRDSRSALLSGTNDFTWFPSVAVSSVNSV